MRVKNKKLAGKVTVMKDVKRYKRKGKETKGNELLGGGQFVATADDWLLIGLVSIPLLPSQARFSD